MATLSEIKSPFVVLEHNETREEFVAYLPHDDMAGDDVTVLRRLTVPEVLNVLRNHF